MKPIINYKPINSFHLTKNQIIEVTLPVTNLKTDFGIFIVKHTNELLNKSILIIDNLVLLEKKENLKFYIKKTDDGQTSSNDLEFSVTNITDIINKVTKKVTKPTKSIKTKKEIKK